MENAENILSERFKLIEECLKVRTEKGRIALKFDEVVDATEDQMKRFLNHPYIQKLKKAA